MSSWDKHCKSGKFVAKSQRAVETLRKIQSTSKESEKTSFLENEVSVSSSYAGGKYGDLARGKDTTSIETRLSFFELGLNSCLLKWIESLGFSVPKKVQNEFLHYLNERTCRHFVIKAPEKSGKTSATLIGILNKLLYDKNKVYPKALMICPTYEIADRTYKCVEQILKYCEIKICLAMKGKKLNKSEQVAADLVIATPDKALELSRSLFDIKNVKYLIFDDAHCMSGADGHLKNISHLCSLLSPRCYIILCALYCNEILNDFIDKYLIQSQMIEIKNELKRNIPEEIFIIYSNNEERIKACICLAKNIFFRDQTVIFCQTREDLNNLKTAFDNENISVEALNSKLKQSQRSHILQQFKENEIKLLIATYSFTHVLEAENVTKVINYSQVLNNNHKLNPDIYNQIENRLNGRKNGLIGSFIQQNWEDSLIQPDALEQVYPKARKMFANDLINGQKI